MDTLKIIEETQDLIRNIDGLTGSDAFEEVIKIFFTLNKYSDEITDYTDLIKLYKNKSCKEYDFFNSDTIKLKDLTIKSLYNILSMIDFKSDDIKGRIFEGFLGRVFTSGLGQFFTPREIVDFMVGYLNNNGYLFEGMNILDPACGSSGILIKTNINSNLYGFDINERLIRVSKMNMTIHNIENYNIINDSFLENHDIPEMDLIITNPPFGVKEKQKEILKNFVFGYNKESVDLEILFLEKIINTLKPGGICAIVLPDGLFNNISSKNVREYLLNECDILSSVDLPDNVFKNTGTGCDTGILFFRKKSQKDIEPEGFKSYKVEYVGYETKTKYAKKINNNDLKRVLDGSLDFCLVTDLDDSKRLDGKFYINREKYKNTKNMGIFIKSGTPIKKVYKYGDTIKYVQYSDIDPVFGLIKSHTEYFLEEAPNRAKIVVKKGDILIPKLKQSLDKVAIVTEEFDGCVVTNGFFVVKPKKDISSEYLFAVFRKNVIHEQIMDLSSGTIMPSIDDNYFKSLKYGVDEEKEVKYIENQIKDVFTLLKKAKNIMTHLQNQP